MVKIEIYSLVVFSFCFLGFILTTLNVDAENQIFFYSFWSAFAIPILLRVIINIFGNGLFSLEGNPMLIQMFRYPKIGI